MVHIKGSVDAVTILCIAGNLMNRRTDVSKEEEVVGSEWSGELDNSRLLDGVGGRYPDPACNNSMFPNEQCLCIYMPIVSSETIDSASACSNPRDHHHFSLSPRHRQHPSLDEATDSRHSLIFAHQS
jgi:hypothetical protein